MARMFAARQLTAVMLGRMEGLVGNVDLDMFELSGEGVDLRDVWNVQQLRGCLGILVVAQLLPAFSGLLLAFLQLCVLLQLASELARLLSFWSPVDWPDELSSFLVREAEG
jgi:hypothetical protein